MSTYSSYPLRTLEDIRRFENEMPLEQRIGARSVYDLFADSAAKHGDRTALTMIMTGAEDETPRQMTHRELLDAMTRTANFFHSLAGPRTGVAYLLPNLIETHLTLWAAESAGFAVPINFLLQAEHIAELIQASGAKILVALGPHPALDIWEKAQEVKRLLPELVLVQVGLSEDASADGAVSFAAGIAEQPGDVRNFGEPGRDDEIAAYFHTGGTTGMPKLVAHTHRNQIVSAFGGAALLDLTEQDIVTNGLPLFHVGGCIVSSLSVLMSGANILILSPAGMRNPLMVKNFWKIAERYQATIIGSVPTALAATLEVPLDGDLSSVRYGIAGAAATPRSVAERFTECTGKALHEILGMTESAGLVSIEPAHAQPVIGSVGLRLPYTDVVVRKLEADGSLGAECAPHEIGVMVVRGPTVTPGYSDPSRNDGTLSPGQINSGDLAYTDEQGRLFIAGRVKDMIIRSGHNIDPVLIEDAILTHPEVLAAGAVSEPDRYAGELPVCYVTLRPGASVTADELRAFVEPKITERPAWPKKIYIVDDIPVTGVGKVFKPQLRSDAARRLLREQLATLLDPGEVEIDVVMGGTRGMEVMIGLPPEHAERRAEVEKLLEGYLFNFKVVAQ